MPPSPYTIYSASAGSGKTSTLVKEYLKIILDPGQSAKFRQILAITFTNKAVNEMKSRILDSLFSFSLSTTPDKGSHIFGEICKDLGMSPEDLKANAGKVLRELLHNYAFFDISTIDKFTHRLIRTFARDLKLSQNFEVVLDTDQLLDEAIARLLAKAGANLRLTDVLIAFAIEKTDDDRSWDIGYDLFKTGKLLFNENHQDHLRLLEGKDLTAFGELKTNIRSGIFKAEENMRLAAAEILQSMSDNGLVRKDFTGGWLPDFMTTIGHGDFGKVNYNAGWKKNFDLEVPYNKNCPDTTKARIDQLLPAWRSIFKQIEQLYYHRSLLLNAYRNLVPLTILNAIDREVKELQKERDLLPISSFNSLIASEIKNQPAPFIYERLGEKYRHYFIDEFQDTSLMQWQNLIPLIGNALESSDARGNHGTLLLVGDAKQAIYRWRGGRAEQFLNLVNQHSSPFTVRPEVEFKPSNYRSHEQIVSFNNDFFNHVSAFLENDIYRQLYTAGSNQQPNQKKGGLVQLEFIASGEMSKDELYCGAVFRQIQNLAGSGIAYGSICILTRTRAQGISLADYLLQEQVPVISSETLLLQRHPKIDFLIALLQYSQQPADRNAAYKILYYLSAAAEKHQVIATHLENPCGFLREQYDFETDYLRHATVYDGLEYAIRCFALAEQSDAHLTFLLDEVYGLEQKEGSSIPVFLQYWEQHKHKLSIVTPEAMNAIRIMTIHKAKGLEFPIVIYPYANTDICSSRREKDAYIWIPADPIKFGGFSELLLSKKKEMTSYNEAAAQLYNEEQQKLALDAFNLLYVALTRAEKALFIISERDLDKGDNPKSGNFSGLFIKYLMSKGLWDKELLTYTFGDLPAANGSRPIAGGTVMIPHQYSFRNRPEFRIITRSGMLWDTARQEALSRGNLLHELMGGVVSGEDIEEAIAAMLRKGMITPAETADLSTTASSIINHSSLSPFYRKGLLVKNESEIITGQGTVLRPDRLVIRGKKATLIDYKSGNQHPAYAFQLQAYAEALENMGFEVENRIIVYLNEGVNPQFI